MSFNEIPMKQVSILLLATALAAGNALAVPQSNPHASHAGHGTPAAAPAQPDPSTKVFDALDADKSGLLSQAELAKHPMAAHASMVDADDDGSLSREEFTAFQKM